MKDFINNKKKMLTLLVFGIIMIVLGVSYARFNYYQEGTNKKLVMGDIYLTLNDGTDDITLNKVFPMTKEEARNQNDNVITFTLSGLNTTDKDIYYEIKLNYGNSETGLDRINDKDLVFDLVEVGQNNEETYIVDAKSFNSINDKKIWVDTVNHNTTTEVVKTYKLRVWLSDKVIISDTDPNKSYCATDNCVSGEKAFKNHYASVKLSVFGDFQEKEVPLSGSEKVLKAITANATGTCENIIHEEDGIKYFSGTNDCINFNYVWYSGKLWRITAIYPDGAMKLVTENNITSIAFNESGQVNFENSYMYNWLNEEFYPTLYNANNIIDTTKKWNATMPIDTNISTKPENTNLVTANVGLLNNYEYYNSYRNLGNYTYGYLNIKYYWRLLNPYDALLVWRVGDDGYAAGNDPTGTYGGRPSIVIKSGLEFTGSGTTSDPYKIVGDKDIGSTNDLVNTRLSGEYVKLKNGSNEQLFRIIDVEDNKTKIIAMDYADNKGNRKFATSDGSANTLWGSGTTTDADTWYDYLNNTYLPNLKTTYNELFDSGTYYLGKSGFNYKLSVCANTTSGNTKECANKAQSGTFNIGLPRYGEMFATQQSGGYSNSITMWLINRYASYVWDMRNSGNAGGNNPTSTRGGRPTLHLKSTVKILTCDGDICDGTQNHPYVVGL